MASEKVFHAYTAGVLLRNPPKAGIGVWFYDEDDHDENQILLNVSEPVQQGEPTKHRAEVKAVTAACMKARPAQGIFFEKLFIHTDSEYVVNVVTNVISEWRDTGRITVEFNEEVTVCEIEEMVDLVTQLNATLELNSPDSSSHGKERAEYFARQGAEKYKKKRNKKIQK
ncbi:uncharacterized protein LOC122500844 [Leptopilina heterotoma]|uniref:uncharacterized protein LOC122500844 n=1 Tax=Leptopilina heterotoma TaxID=63436 RepID=UPI001CA861D5|nr:uncharacterized protein LOC122500844 [Leptopilina heterotoma]XP_043465905.1 uncharacterized protein LOC122500844 [Leptopilina heterotoma]